MVHRRVGRRIVFSALVLSLVMGLAATAAASAQRPAVSTTISPIASGPMSPYEREVGPPPGPECVCAGFIRICYPIWNCDASGCVKIQYCEWECVEWICSA
jgi:hypothetical protein